MTLVIKRRKLPFNNDATKVGNAGQSRLERSRLLLAQHRVAGAAGSPLS
mgnify:FL=1